MYFKIFRNNDDALVVLTDWMTEGVGSGSGGSEE